MFAFVSRVWRIQYPERYMFDEVYHAVTAKLMARNDPRAYEWWNEPVEENTAVDWLHPPFAKLTQAFFIRIFGENAVGWRMSSVMFGTGVVFATALLSYQLFSSKPISLLSAFLVSLDGLLLVQSRIAMNDVHVTFFILLALTSYVAWKRSQNRSKQKISPSTKWYFMGSGLFLGLAVASKWSGIFVLAIFTLDQIATLLYKKTFPSIHGFFTKYLVWIVLPLTVYLLSYSQMFLQGKTLFCFQQKQTQGKCYFETYKLGENIIYQGFVSHFFALHKQIWWYQTHLDAEHTYQSRPLQWALNIRPVWVFVDFIDKDTVANIYAQGNTALFWLGIISIGILPFSFFVWKKNVYIFTSMSKSVTLKFFLQKNQWFKWFICISYCLVWIPWIFSPRIMFFYHYLPAVPLLSIILAWSIYKLFHHSNVGKVLTVSVVTLVVSNFFIFYPHWTALPVSKDFADKVYFIFDVWK